jgi:hypothetical protein
MCLEIKMKYKKGSANMWWIIIGAVIALVVMIILMVMFTGKSNKLELGLMSCEGKDGICNLNPQECKDTGGTVSYAFECSEEQKGGKANARCCFKGDKKTDNSKKED